MNENVNIPASTAGLTTKVVKGSIWTLAGQVAPLAVSLVTTPFVIRMLGAEGYGVLIFVGLIPGYFGFADFGMSIASTKFGSEAYAANDPDREARVVRTAAVIAFLASLPIAIAIVVSSGWIVTLFNVPERLQAEAALALKLAAVTFGVNLLNGIFNTPQLARLRMDLNTFVTSGFRILGIIATPIVIYLGGGILGAVVILMIASFLTLAGHIYISGRLLPGLFDRSIDRRVIRPMLQFGGALAVSSIAALMLVNVEKVVLTRAASVEELAYYSVAFTFASMATMFSAAMIQSLVPAFSQLLVPEKRDQLNNLFARSLRINVLLMLPIIATLFVVARTLFTHWAGPDFGRESTLPFYVLLGGLFFNILAYIPHSLIMAYGRTDIFAKLYWLELLPYIGLVVLLTSSYGAVGAAVAWSLRCTFDAALIGYLARKTTGISYGLFRRNAGAFLIAQLLLAIPMVLAFYSLEFPLWAVLTLPLSLLGYLTFAWGRILESGEKTWLTSRLQSVNAK